MKINLKCWKSYSHTLDAWIKGLSFDLLPLWCHNLDDEPKLELWLVTYTTPQIQIVHHWTCSYHFSIYFHFLTKLNNFLCHWMWKLEGYNYTLSVKSIKKCRKHSLLEFFWRNSSKLFSNFNPISSSFLVYLEWFTT
jgi:hypothetical protein